MRARRLRLAPLAALLLAACDVELTEQEVQVVVDAERDVADVQMVYVGFGTTQRGDTAVAKAEQALRDLHARKAILLGSTVGAIDLRGKELAPLELQRWIHVENGPLFHDPQLGLGYVQWIHLRELRTLLQMLDEHARNAARREMAAQGTLMGARFSLPTLAAVRAWLGTSTPAVTLQGSALVFRAPVPQAEFLAARTAAVDEFVKEWSRESRHDDATAEPRRANHPLLAMALDGTLRMTWEDGMAILAIGRTDAPRCSLRWRAPARDARAAPKALAESLATRATLPQAPGAAELAAGFAAFRERMRAAGALQPATRKTGG
ncbi:MAG: hypothetical protein IT458_17815 [Planctomycetes bacterium]|nr:hypothetical protein [Planctomycetota bacterium]